MKQKPQILKVLLLISIYCFGLFLSAHTTTYFNSQKAKQDTEQLTYLVTASKVFQTHIQQSENLFSEITEFSLPNLQLSSDDFLAITYANRLEFNSKFKQYKNYLNNTLIRHRKSDLLFPFHNFW